MNTLKLIILLAISASNNICASDDVYTNNICASDDAYAELIEKKDKMLHLLSRNYQVLIECSDDLQRFMENQDEYEYDSDCEKFVTPRGKIFRTTLEFNSKQVNELVPLVKQIQQIILTEQQILLNQQKLLKDTDLLQKNTDEKGAL